MREFFFEKNMRFGLQFIVLEPGLVDVGWGALVKGLVRKGGAEGKG